MFGIRVHHFHNVTQMYKSSFLRFTPEIPLPFDRSVRVPDIFLEPQPDINISLVTTVTVALVTVVMASVDEPDILNNGGLLFRKMAVRHTF